MNHSTNFNPQHILCPVDFSDLSDLALKYAAAGAHIYGAKLIVLHSELFELPRYFSKSETDRLAQEVANFRNMLQKDLAEHVAKILNKNAERLDIEFVVTEVHPVDAIMQTADKKTIDLIVLGTHGLSGVKRLLLGSVAENIIHYSRIPVFTVRQKEHDFIDVNSPDNVPRLEHILCACEVNEFDRATLEHAVSLAEHFNARLTVLYSNESQRPEDLSLTKETLFSWIAGTVKNHYNLEPVVLKGGAADQIITYAKNEKTDLIVIGARHKIFHDATVLGKTTDLVVRHAPTPVLIIPAFSES